MGIIKREDIRQETYREILDVETHHDHPIIEDENGMYRWKHSIDTTRELEEISLNDLIPLLWSLGIDKNSELYRLLYRNMGYSLSGYWEIFYWEVNNPQAAEYEPNSK